MKEVNMLKFSSILVLSMLLASAVFAQVPYQGTPEDYSLGAVDPIMLPWVSDVVAWSNMPSSTDLTGRSAAGILGNYMYVFGSGSLTNIGIAFNLTTETWVASTPPPLGVDNWTGVATNTDLYIIGRYTGSAYGNEIQKFTPTGGGPTGTWTQMAVMPVAVCGRAAAWDGGDYIYAAGSSSTTYNTTCHRYSISANTWTTLAPMPVGNGYAGGAYVAGKFYVIGGTVAAALGTTVQAYDPGTNTWATMAPLPTPVWFATFSTTFNSQYMFSVGGGGGYGTWPATNAVQVYNPATNTWTQETVLPAAYGCNAARWVSPDKVISTGGYTGTAFVGTTYKGIGFPTGGPPPALVVTVTPTGSTTVPNTGGTIPFAITVLNNGPAQPYTVWGRVRDTGGAYYPPNVGPITINTPVGVTITRNRILTVPAGWRSGNYYQVWYGNTSFSYPAIDADSFMFTKSVVTGNGPFVIGESTCDGELFPGEIAATPTTSTIISNYPNPFNPSTTIHFTLGDAANVNLTVYDVNGREVANLVNGYRQAGAQAVTFDGTNLASGVYLYKLTADGNTSIAKMILMK